MDIHYSKKIIKETLKFKELVIFRYIVFIIFNLLVIVFSVAIFFNFIYFVFFRRIIYMIIG